MTLVLNIRRPVQLPVGVVLLDFVRTGDYPPIPIAEPNLILAVAAGYKHAAGGVGLAVKTGWRSGDIAAATKLSWSSTPVAIKLVYALWRKTPLTLQHTKSGWTGSWPLITELLRYGWGGYQQIAAHLKTYWARWPVVAEQLQTTWLPVLQRKQTLTGSSWQHTEITQRNTDIFYNHGADITHGYKLPYGPKPPSYICSNDYRPQKGTIVLNLTVPAAPAAGSVSVNFSNVGNPIVCVLDNGGGLIWPLPDLPTVDTTKPITPPRRRSYIMQPELRCYRVSDNAEVNITGASISTSRSQWGATISLQCGSRGDKDLLFAGSPQEFKLVINGFEFYGLAEEPSVNAAFGKTSWTVAGRSNIAALASPHIAPKSYTNATTKGVAALVTDELGFSGWTLSFDMDQFNVPAGAFSYVSKTPIEAIAQIATAIGGMIYTDGATKTLHIAPQWPVTPWAMDSATPDIAVHDDVIISYTSRPAINPLYDKVFVRGEQQGVFRGVRRTGTAGTSVAPDVVDPLITDNQAARQRGTAELANSGSKDAITLELPIMDLLPICQPGMILGVTWQTDVFKALIDTLSITAQRSDSGALTVRQSVGVLRSYE
jgi:hypothetical protein